MPKSPKRQPTSTKKSPAKPKKTASLQEAERKKAILEGVKRSSGSVKATLKQLGLGQSTYYRWQKQFKAQGAEGLKAGAPVSDKVWKRFGELLKKQEKQPGAESKLRAQEKDIMKSDQDKEKIRKLLFKRFDEEPSKPVEKTERTPHPAEPKASGGPSSPSDTPPPEDPMDRMLKYAIGGFALVIVILLMASLSNSSNFYFKQKEQMIELWQGRFAPMGKKRVATFSDPTIIKSLPEQSTYTKRQAHGVVAKYYIKLADKMLRTGEIPDLKGAKSYLAQASKYAASDATRQAIKERLGSIRRVKDNLQRYGETR
ncbi:MAG: helix-turn-helix domain-containing protein [Thermodesulfobacteriota bacterium]|nr:helix-turn-helix domain-containing protein [Thermodesulfobacteriota bacterium]